MKTGHRINIDTLHKYLSLVFIKFPLEDTLYAGNIDVIKNVVPALTGIYAIFYKDGGQCFYVGRAMNLRSRLIRHYGIDARDNYRKILGKLKHPEQFRFYEIKEPSEISRQQFICLLSAIESTCSASWKPEVKSRTF